MLIYSAVCLINFSLMYFWMDESIRFLMIDNRKEEGYDCLKNLIVQNNPEKLFYI